MVPTATACSRSSPGSPKGHVLGQRETELDEVGRERRRTRHSQCDERCGDQPDGCQRSDQPCDAVRWRRYRHGRSDTCLVIEHEEYCRDVADPCATVLDQASAQECPHGRRDIGRECLPGWLEADDRAEHLRHILAIKGAAPRQHLVQHAAECPDVAALVSLSSFRLLRGHVRGCSEDDARAGQHGRARDGRRLRTAGRAHRVLLGCQRLREPEIQHLHSPVRAQFDVRGLEIAMDDALLVRGFKSFRDLFRDRQCFVERDRPASNALRQIVALDEFHHERRDASALFQAVDGRDVRMIQRGEDFGFSLKSGQSVSIRGEDVGRILMAT